MAGFFGNVMEIFRGGSNTPPQLQQVPGNPNQPQNPNLAPQQNVQQNQQQQQQNVQQVKEPSPEEAFKDLWTIDPKTTPQATPLGEFTYNIDPAKVQKNVSGLDFTKTITPELIAKIKAGGDDSVSAVLTAMNTVGQQVMANSMIASAKITETGLRTNGQRVEEALPRMIHQQTVSNALREDNPLFTDPSTAPVFAAIEQQFALKFPQATPQEIRAQSKEYMTNFIAKGAEFTGLTVSRAPANASSQGKSAQTDWSSEPA